MEPRGSRNPRVVRKFSESGLLTFILFSTFTIHYVGGEAISAQVDVGEIQVTSFRKRLVTGCASLAVDGLRMQHSAGRVSHAAFCTLMSGRTITGLCKVTSHRNRDRGHYLG